VLDIGCGYGRIMRTLSTAHGPTVIGVDVASGMLRRARAEGVESPLAVMRAEALGLADASFELVTLVAVLTAVAYEAAVRAVLAEAWRVLRPGGALYIGDFLVDPTPERLPRYEQGLRETGEWGMFQLNGAQGGFVRHFEPTDLRRLVRQFYITDWQEQTTRSMNNNPVRAVALTARKPGPTTESV
jgi:ubiquinone/menaquinone biosynthesis C-methylase UbiE